MSNVAFSPPTLALHLAFLVAALGALDGAGGVIDPRTSARLGRLELAEGARLDAVRAQQGARFLAHAVVMAALWRAPAVGACMAAAVGSGWLGSAAVLMVAALRDRRSARMLRLVGTLGGGLALWWPLWLYLAALRAMTLVGAPT